MDARRQLQGVQRLSIAGRLGGHVGQHRGVAGQRAQALTQHAGQLAVPARQVLLPVEDADENVAQSGQGEATGPLGAVKAAQVKEVESAPPTGHTPGPALWAVEAVLVDVKGVEEVRLAAMRVVGAGAQRRVQVERRLLHC